MAANLIRGLIGGCLAALLEASSWVVSAEVLTDPTRQPAELSVLPISGVRANAPKNIKLQSIIISPERRAAIINGQTVKVGDPVDDETLVEVNEGSVVLQGKQGRKVLTLFPGVEIRKNAPAELSEKKNVVNTVKKKHPGKKHRSGQSSDHTVQPEKNEGGEK
jgi:MSHA biogenesis protein MshK